MTLTLNKKYIPDCHILTSLSCLFAEENPHPIPYLGLNPKIYHFSLSLSAKGKGLDGQQGFEPDDLWKKS